VALATFPDLEAFTDWIRFDADDTFRQLRHWVRQSSGWDLAAVAEWLEPEQRRDIFKFLTRFGEERRVYQNLSREVLSKLLAVREWVVGDQVVDEDAIAGFFYHTGATPVSIPRSLTEDSVRMRTDSGEEALRRPSPPSWSSLAEGAELPAPGEEELVGDRCLPARLVGERPLEHLTEPLSGKDSQAFSDPACAGSDASDLLAVVAVVGTVAAATLALDAYRKRR